MQDERVRRGAAMAFRKGLDCLLAGDVDGWLAMWAPDGVMEFPFAPTGYPRRLDGKPAIAAYMAGFPEILRLTAFPEVRIHHTLDPEVMIVEFATEGEAVRTGRPYNQTYVSVIRTKDGSVVLYRDYWNPLVAMEALGGAEAFVDAFGGSSAP